VPRLAEVIDAVVGIDTHRDVHVAELADRAGAPLALVQIPNTDAGFAELLGWITRHRPGPRVAVSIEGTRSFGIGVARAVSAAGLPVIECEQPARKARRGRGKSDQIDAHLAVLSALQLDADRLPTPRADGIREALRILLGARQELTATATGCARCCCPARTEIETSAELA
jgi:transposase